MRTSIRNTAMATSLGLAVVAAVALTVADGASADTDAKIADAMSAAPAAVSAKAMVMDWPTSTNAEGEMLRDGTNGWVCMPDDPSTPGGDPMCVDGQSVKWFEGWTTKTEPKLDAPGLGYMLKGGRTASNT